MAEDPNSSDGRLAERLDRLFRSVHPPGKKEYSNDAVAEALTATGVKVSGAYLQQLRNGVKDNPSTRLLEALAAYFGVPTAYFFQDEEAAQVDLGVAVLTKLLLEADAFDIAARLADLPADSRELVRQLVDHLAQVKGLPTAAAGPPATGPAGGGGTGAGTNDEVDQR
jgi:transcriptional regulator with XRE-family HTH domain